MLKKPEEQQTRKKLQDYSYCLTHQIGKGYSSQVYRGRNDLTDLPVAIKIIDMRMIKNDIHKNLLASEIQVLRCLRNTENIIQAFEIYNSKNNTYIITEICDGGDLSKLIATKKQLSETEAIKIMAQILKGYASIYRKGVIHRDLKPANIFMKEEEVKIADFGFAMRVADAKKYSSYNVGSPIYMPPEALNENNYSFKSDVWALGVIYYELLTGRTPWRAKTEKELGKQLLSIPISKLLPKSLSSSSVDFLTRTLTVNIEERMSPEEAGRFHLSGSNTLGELSSSNSLFNTRNNTITGSKEASCKEIAQKPILASTTSKTMRNIAGRTTIDTSKAQENEMKCELGSKIDNTFHSKTENSISHPLHQTNPRINDENCPASINVNQTNDNEGAKNDCKLLSKQLLSQVHFCRFVFKLITRISSNLSDSVKNHMGVLQQMLTHQVYDRLNSLEQLSLLDSTAQTEFQASNECKKLLNIVKQYQTKYKQELSTISPQPSSYSVLKQELAKQIVDLYHQVAQQSNLNNVKEEVIALDYLVTLKQLLSLIHNLDLDGFHAKSKMEAIVEGVPAKVITAEHITAIASKLKALKML